MKLWIDEDLSPSLVEVCHEVGFQATSVRDRGKLSTKDHALAEILLDEGWVLVTDNAGDFLRLAEDAGVHPGLVFIELGSAQVERDWLAAAIAHVGESQPSRAIPRNRRRPGNVAPILTRRLHFPPLAPISGA